MKKLIDFLLIFLLAFFIINLFQKDKNKETPESNIIFSTTSNSYTVPAGIKLNIKNNTNSGITIDTCKDILISNETESITTSPDFCSKISVKPLETYILDYSSEYKLFMKTGDYVFKIKVAEKDYTKTFKIENRGSIKKIFTSVFYAPIYNLMIFLVKLFGNSLGWGIIIITIIIRLVLLWPQHKMMLSQKKLQNIQPKIKKLQEEHKGNQQVLGMKLMELYKTEKVNPMGSCGFLVIQMPILLVIYNIILSIKDVSNHYYIYSFLSNFDFLAVSYNFFGLNLLGTGGISGIILALLVGLVQFLQVKFSLANNKKSAKEVVLEKKQGENSYSQFMPDPEMMNKFMLYGMPAMVGVFTYSIIAGVGVYWLISTTFMIFQQLIVNKILKK